MLYSLLMSPFVKQYSDEELLQWYQDLADELGRTPVSGDFHAHGGPSVMTYFRRFGSLGKVAKLAGRKPRPRGYNGRVV